MYVPAGLLLPDGAALIRPGESPAGSRHVGPASNSAAGRYIRRRAGHVAGWRLRLTRPGEPAPAGNIPEPLQRIRRWNTEVGHPVFPPADQL
ncbi:hypothetical protein LNO88_03890 [Klebsiella pneumoniae subsp. pneumoniae]|nr:hypothetical protein [Klebsiella pneumoniae subsp. pneumoniae]